MPAAAEGGRRARRPPGTSMTFGAGDKAPSPAGLRDYSAPLAVPPRDVLLVATPLRSAKRFTEGRRRLHAPNSSTRRRGDSRTAGSRRDGGLPVAGLGRIPRVTAAQVRRPWRYPRLRGKDDWAARFSCRDVDDTAPRLRAGSRKPAAGVGLTRSPVRAPRISNATAAACWRPRTRGRSSFNDVGTGRVENLGNRPHVDLRR